MAADASIFAQYLKPVKSVSEYQDEGDKRTLSRLKLLLGQQEVEQKQQGFADDQKFRGISAQYGNDQTALLNALRSGGLYGKAKDIEAGIADIAAKKATAAKSMADADKDQWSIKQGKLDRVGQAFGWLRDNATAENALSVAQRLVDDGIWTPEQAQAGMSQIAQTPTPENIAKIATLGYQSILSAKDQLPKIQVQNLGGSSQIASVPALGGAPTVLSNTPITQDANSIASNARIASEGAANRGVQMRGQNMTDSRAREANTLQKDAARSQVLETADGFVLVDKGSGTTKPLAGADGAALARKLKDAPASVQSAMMENSANLRKAQNALDLIQGKQVGVMQGDKQATGFKGFAPDVLLNRMDEKGVDTRASIADLGSMIIHDRSGAAVTASEFPRLQPFIPKVNDSPAVAEKKLKRFVQIYGEELTAMQNSYGPDSGYRQPGGKVPKPATAGSAFSDAEKERRYQEWKAGQK